MRFLIGLALALIVSSVSFAQQSTITYQGQLRSSGTPFTGLADLEFTLYDQIVGGNQVGPAQACVDCPVEDGLFQVELDFGSSAFDAGQRWLEISVDGVVLAPRQRVSAAPVAVFALSGNEGPPGPQGEQGIAGPTGPPGPAGPANVGHARLVRDLNNTDLVGASAGSPEVVSRITLDSDKKYVVTVSYQMDVTDGLLVCEVVQQGSDTRLTAQSLGNSSEVLTTVSRRESLDLLVDPAQLDPALLPNLELRCFRNSTFGGVRDARWLVFEAESIEESSQTTTP